MAFIYFNPNPEKKSVGDCVIRAISKLTNKEWEETYLAVCLQGYLMHDMPSSNSVWGGYMKSKGYLKTLLPNVCPNCYTVIEFCRDHPVGSFLVNTDEHVVAIVDGDYYDTWDSGNEIVNYYWEKE